MFTKIKEYFQYRRNKRTLTLILMTQYYDFLVAETEAKNTEKETYEQLSKFAGDVDIAELSDTFAAITKIANDPNLTSEFYSHIHETTKGEKA